MNSKTLKTFGIIFVIILLANMILFALKTINGLVFWLIILIVALIAFFVIPKFNKP